MGAARTGGTAAGLLLCSPHSDSPTPGALSLSPRWTLGQEQQGGDLSSCVIVQEFGSLVLYATEGSCGLDPVAWPPPELFPSV